MVSFPRNEWSAWAEIRRNGLQVAITTHSPHFINILGLEGLAVVRKGGDGTHIVQLTPSELVQKCVSSGAPAERTTPDSILPFYAANSSREILEGFFAKVVVLVEGPSEALALPVLLERVGMVTAREGIAIIPVGGKGNLGKWRRLYAAYGIPTYVVFDNDGRTDDRSGSKRMDALKSIGVAADDCEGLLQLRDWLVEDSFMVFGENYEEAMRSAFDDYATVEASAYAVGVEAKPFVARWAANHVDLTDQIGTRSHRRVCVSLEGPSPNSGGPR